MKARMMRRMRPEKMNMKLKIGGMLISQERKRGTYLNNL